MLHGLIGEWQLFNAFSGITSRVAIFGISELLASESAEQTLPVGVATRAVVGVEVRVVIVKGGDKIVGEEVGIGESVSPTSQYVVIFPFPFISTSPRSSSLNVLKVSRILLVALLT